MRSLRRSRSPRQRSKTVRVGVLPACADVGHADLDVAGLALPCLRPDADRGAGPQSLAHRGVGEQGVKGCARPARWPSRRRRSARRPGRRGRSGPGRARGLGLPTQQRFKPDLRVVAGEAGAVALVARAQGAAAEGVHLERCSSGSAGRRNHHRHVARPAAKRSGIHLRQPTTCPILDAWPTCRPTATGAPTPSRTPSPS